MRRFHINLNRLAVLSAALCALATILWVVSFHVEWHLTFYTASSRYVIRMKDGSVGWYGPGQGGSLNAVDQELVAKMSNDDFVWEKPNQVINGWFIKGNAKPGSATAQLYEHCASSIREYPAMAPYARAWLAALRDPNRFVPAQTMLLLHTGQWRQANAWGGLPAVSFALDQKTGKPDLSARQSLIAQWHDRLEAPLYLVWFVWLVLALLIVPFAWLVRPRRAGGAASWGLAGAALASLILIYVLSVGWARSFQMGDAWVACPRELSVTPQAQRYSIWAYDEKSVISRRGRVQFLQAIRFSSSRPTPHPIEHRMGVEIQPFPLIGPTVSRSIEARWKIPGVIYIGHPSQTVMRPGSMLKLVPTTMMMNGSKTTVQVRIAVPVPGLPPVAEPVYSAHSLVISYWLPIVVASILPLLAMWKRLQRWRTDLRGLCPICGYDLRATPDRCPECGLVPVKAQADSRCTSAPT